VLTFDSDGNLDIEHQYAQLQADVDHLESTDYSPTPATTETHESTTEWRPDAATRRQLIAAAMPSYAMRRPGRCLTMAPDCRIAPNRYSTV
jgi:hypothetical protein